MIFYNLKKKIHILRVITIGLIVCVILKLGYSQFFEYEKISLKATELWERSFPLEAARGNIYDANMEILASNLPTMSVVVIPFQVKDKEQCAQKLAKILNADYEKILAKISKSVSIERLSPEGRQISEEQAKAITDLKMDGVYVVQDSKRYYPFNELLAPSLGFVGIDNQGLAGIEGKYDDYLKGKNGSLNYKMDAKGGLMNGFISRIESPVSGLSLQLTVDLKIQEIVERELTNAYAKYKPDSIMALAMNPNNGDILAISNRPTYNPNEYQNATQEVYNRNLPIWMNFEPGSTFKSFSFAAGLEEKEFDMFKDTYYDTGSVVVEGRVIKSWKKGGHGLQTFLEVLENSSNPGFVEISRRLGAEKLYEYVKAFGFSKKTGVDLVGESSGIFFDYEDYGELENATTAFGQGISTTAIQLVRAFCALINGGTLYVPKISKSLILTSTQEVLFDFPTAIERENVISKETSGLMRYALESVVSKGSGRKAYIEGYKVGGKTGTAQKAVNGVYLENEYILSFLAGAPMDNPQIVVYVAMDNPKSTIQYGGTIIGPIIKNILEDALMILGVEKTYDGIEFEYTWMDTKTYEVENYIGKDRSALKSKYFKFEIIGEGDQVLDQLPKVGTKLEEGKTIVVFMG